MYINRTYINVHGCFVTVYNVYTEQIMFDKLTIKLGLEKLIILYGPSKLGGVTFSCVP